MRFIPQILKLANNKVTVACSGGIDSLAIAAFLKIYYPRINLQCFHFNHNLREQNEIMSNSVFTFCKDFNIRWEESYRNGNYDDTDPKDESTLRALRYKAMAGLGYVITGHHIDDACENYMFNCLNGVPEYLPIPLVTEYKDFDLTVIRPFILNEKEEFRAFVKDYDLEQYVVEDETNTDEGYRRNWLRNNLIPQISEKGYNLKTIVKKRYEKYIKENY
jgi:tRNA(Ile)-lysidine synthase